jgi:hypothetical protein
MNMMERELIGVIGQARQLSKDGTTYHVVYDTATGGHVVCHESNDFELEFAHRETIYSFRGGKKTYHRLSNMSQA